MSQYNEEINVSSENNHKNCHHSHRGKFLWRSPLGISALVVIGVLLAAYLFAVHGGHIKGWFAQYGWIILVLICPLMHLFHGGHHSHKNHEHNEHKAESEDNK